MELPGGDAVLGPVDLLASQLALRSLAAEHPEVRRARVEVEHQRLGRRADLDRGQVLDIEELGDGRNLACAKCQRLSV